MGGPTGVADPDAAVGRFALDERLEPGQLALAADDPHSPVVGDREARRVIAAVFELAKPRDEQRGRFP